MNDKSLLLGVLFAAVNLAAFLIMSSDKAKSRSQEAERVPEGLIFFMAAAFGSVGVFAGMLFFRHKTRKWYFILGIPLLILENMASLYLVYLALAGKM